MIVDIGGDTTDVARFLSWWNREYTVQFVSEALS